MKFKKLLTAALVTGVVATGALGFAGCKKNDEFNINAKDVYAMCASSSVDYLKRLNSEPEPASSMVQFTTTVRPSFISEDDEAGMKSSLLLFDTMMTSGIKQTTTSNDGSDLRFDTSAYPLVMEITFPKASGAESYKLYYKEINSRTNKEVDDGKVELEVSSDITGTLVVDETLYTVTGKREFEEEGNEKESSIEFKTYLDSQNYVVFEQEVEDGEVEYEYKIYQNGNKVQDSELEIEKTRRGYEIEFQLLDLALSTPTTSQYKIYINQANEIMIRFTKENQTETISVTKTLDGYEFNYSTPAV